MITVKLYKGKRLFSAQHDAEGTMSDDGVYVLFEQFWPNGECMHRRLRSWDGTIDHIDMDEDGSLVRVITTESGLPQDDAIPMYGDEEVYYNMRQRFDAAWDKCGGRIFEYSC